MTTANLRQVTRMEGKLNYGWARLDAGAFARGLSRRAIFGKVLGNVCGGRVFSAGLEGKLFGLFWDFGGVLAHGHRAREGVKGCSRRAPAAEAAATAARGSYRSVPLGSAS